MLISHWRPARPRWQLPETPRDPQLPMDLDSRVRKDPKAWPGRKESTPLLRRGACPLGEAVHDRGRGSLQRLGPAGVLGADTWAPRGGGADIPEGPLTLLA